jgi:hypothetical protein
MVEGEDGGKTRAVAEEVAAALERALNGGSA